MSKQIIAEQSAIERWKMYKYIRYLFLIILFCKFINPLQANAATINAYSCSQTDVQAAINSASDGDTVLVPAGSCTWTTNVSWQYKTINLIGAGIGNTIITSNGRAISIRNSAAKPSFRISGITFFGTTTESSIIHVSSEWTPTPVKGWRIDNIRFNYTGSIGGAIYVAGINWGVIDNCIFDGVGYVSIYINGYIDGEWNADPMLKAMGDASWLLPLNLGTGEAVYVEDCTWNFTSSDVSACFDMYNGGRIVFRHNKVNGTYLETHATRWSERGGLKYEVYNNVMNGVRPGKDPFIWPIMFRSGTGVIFNNTVSGYRTNNFIIDNQRTCMAFGGKYTRCDGSNSYDGNTDGEFGWPCLDQIGRGSGVAAGSPQPSVPLYAWNNGLSAIVLNGNFDLCTSTLPNLSNHLKTKGDLYPHTGGVLDYVNNGTTPKTGYIPYTYPHPLRTLEAPLNFRFID